MTSRTEEGDSHASMVSSTTSGDGRRRRKQATKKTKGLERLPPCLICREPASGLHYGVNSCSACKAFFLRNWTRQNHLVCEGEGTCRSIPGSGLGCPACRMKRCLKAGMSLTGTRRGRYTHETRVKINKDAEKMLGDKSEYFQKINSAVPVTEVQSLDLSSSKDTNLDDTTTCLPPVKLEEPMKENDTFYANLSLQPLDLRNPRREDSLEPFSSHEEYLSIHNETGSLRNLTEATTANYDLPAFHPNQGDPQRPSNSTASPSQSFLSMMDMGDGDSEMSTAAEPQNRSEDVRRLVESISWFSGSFQEPNSTPLPLDTQSTSTGTDIEDDDYTKLQEVICTMLTASKTEKLQLKRIAENLTEIHKKYDQYPEGFFDRVAGIQKQFLEQKKVKEDLFGPMRITHDEYQRVYQSTGLDIDGRKALVERNTNRYEEWYLKYIKFAKSLPHFLEIPVQDQIAILKAAKTQYVALSDYQAFDADKLLYTDNNGETYDVDDFNKVFSSQYTTTMAEFVRTLKALNLTEEERNIMKAICLFTPEYCVTDIGRQKAKDQYVQLIHVLAYLLIENHGHDLTFQKRLLEARELSKIFSRMDALEKWNVLSLYGENTSLSVAVDLYNPGDDSSTD